MNKMVDLEKKKSVRPTLSAEYRVQSPSLTVTLSYGRLLL